MERKSFRINIIDSHTGGEPTRMVYSGFPRLNGETIAEKLQDFRVNHDDLRQGIILEPRGSDVLVGALVCESSDKKATAGVIFFNNEGYLGMCGHGSIGVIASLAYQGRITTGEHWLETPVGMVKAILHEDHSVSIVNVPSYRYKARVPIDVPELGLIHGDIAWGGNWFFLVNDHQQNIASGNVKQLTAISIQIKDALKAANITGKNGEEIDHIELFGQPTGEADSKSFVLCPGSAYDRSPCGTGTSAKLACLAMDRQLQAGVTWRQESVIGSIFEASYAFCHETDLPDNAIIPTIRGKAYISLEGTLIMQERDPFCHGIITH